MLHSIILLATAAVAEATGLAARSAHTITFGSGSATPLSAKTDAPACSTIGPDALTTDMPTVPFDLGSVPLPTSAVPVITFVTESTATYTVVVAPDWTDLCQISTLLPTTAQPAYKSFATSALSWFAVHSSAVYASKDQCQRSWGEFQQAHHKGYGDLDTVILAASCEGNFKELGNVTSTNGALSSHTGLGAAVIAGLAGVVVAMVMAF